MMLQRTSVSITISMVLCGLVLPTTPLTEKVKRYNTVQISNCMPSINGGIAAYMYIDLNYIISIFHTCTF
jgi:hypothetical protein